jgi:hypothetical protein
MKFAELKGHHGKVRGCGAQQNCLANAEATDAAQKDVVEFLKQISTNSRSTENEPALNIRRRRSLVIWEHRIAREEFMRKFLNVGAIVMVSTTATAQAAETDYRLTACAHANSITLTARLLVQPNSLLSAEKSLFFERFSLLIFVANFTERHCSAAVSCSEIPVLGPEIAKFPVSREIGWRQVRSALRRQPAIRAFDEAPQETRESRLFRAFAFVSRLPVRRS